MIGCNDIAHKSVGLMVFGVNNSWEIMTRSAIMAVRRAGFCLYRSESANQHSADIDINTILLECLSFV